MSRNVIETVMGAVVLVVAALFLFFAYSTSQIREVGGYDVTARFSKVDGIREGGDVRISGIKVGSILSLALDPSSYMAIVRMSIEPTIKLPTDTVAEILSNGLLGDKYLALVPGAADRMIKPGGEITYTQAPMSIEDMIGQYLFSSSGKAGAGGSAQGPGAAAAPPSLDGAAPAPQPAAPK